MAEYRTTSTQSIHNTPTTIPPSPEEGVVAHVTRSAQNGLYSCFGCLQASPAKAKIVYTEYEMDQLKKAFGVEYMNTLKGASSPTAATPQLQACIDRFLREIGTLEAIVAELRTEVDTKRQEVQRKIQQKPGDSSTTPITTAAPPVTGVVHDTASATSSETAAQPSATTELTTVSTTAALTGTGDGMISAVSGQYQAEDAAPMEDVPLDKK